MKPGIQSCGWLGDISRNSIRWVTRESRALAQWKESAFGWAYMITCMVDRWGLTRSLPGNRHYASRTISDRENGSMKLESDSPPFHYSDLRYWKLFLMQHALSKIPHPADESSVAEIYPHRVLAGPKINMFLMIEGTTRFGLWGFTSPPLQVHSVAWWALKCPVRLFRRSFMM
jgi:hypothetical protein